MKNFENPVISSDLEDKSKKIEKLNRLAENSEHLGLDNVEKEKLIDKADKLNIELELLEEISGLSYEEIESIYTNTSKEQAILETKKFFNKLTEENQQEIIKSNERTFLEIAKKYITPKQLVMATIGFLMITSNAYGEHVDLKKIKDNPDTVMVNLGEIIQDTKPKEQKSSEKINLSPEQEKQINEVIIPKILDKFIGFTYAEMAIMSQRSIDYSKIEGDPRLIMLFFDEPVERELLDDYLIRQAKRGVLNEKDVDILYEYFSHVEYNIN
ncbi:MAG: hypothetical protein ACKUBY_01790 [Candidatus Moraniibacteriota bacterium]|jgi:hypothetical protein